MEKPFRLIVCENAFAESDTRQLDSLLTQECPGSVLIELHLSPDASDRNVNQLIDHINRMRETHAMIPVRIFRDGADPASLKAENAAVLPPNLRLRACKDMQTMLASGADPEVWLKEHAETLPFAGSVQPQPDAPPEKPYDRVLRLERLRIYSSANALYTNTDFLWGVLLLLCYAAVTRLAPGAYFLPPWLLAGLACLFLLCGVARLSLRLLRLLRQRRS